MQRGSLFFALWNMPHPFAHKAKNQGHPKVSLKN